MLTYQPKDPAIAAVVASLVLALSEIGAFDRLGVSSGDVVFWGGIAVIGLTAIRAIWIKIWPESASRFLGGVKSDGVPDEEVDDVTSPEGVPRGVGLISALGVLVMGSLVALAVMMSGCAGYQGPGLESVVNRIDIGKAIECARQPTARDKARCLGVEVMTVGIGAALDQAEHWGTRALQAASGAGADDLTDADRRRIARNADEALDRLGAEIAYANGGPEPR